MYVKGGGLGVSTGYVYHIDYLTWQQYYHDLMQS